MSVCKQFSALNKVIIVTINAISKVMRWKPMMMAMVVLLVNSAHGAQLRRSPARLSLSLRLHQEGRAATAAVLACHNPSSTTT